MRRAETGDQSGASGRTAGGQGSLSYQFLVDAPAASADGVVTLRFQDVEADYDPSIADVWVIPVD